MAQSNDPSPGALSPLAIATITLLKFWMESPDFWLTEVETKFFIPRITSPITKYFHLVAALPAEFGHQVADTLNTTTGPLFYDTLKHAIVSRLNPPLSTQLRIFLHPEEMRDSTPFHYLRCLVRHLGH